MSGYRIGKEDLKALIELAGTPEQADSYIREFANITKLEEKFELICELYNISVPEYSGEEQVKNDYEAALRSLINQKWGKSVSEIMSKNIRPDKLPEENRKGKNAAGFIFFAICFALIAVLFIFFRDANYYAIMLTAALSFAAGVLAGRFLFGKR